MRYIFPVLFTLLFIGCSLKESKDILIKVDDNVSCKEKTQKNILKDTRIYDLENIPQDVAFFAKTINSENIIYDIQKRYEDDYFSVWNTDTPPESLESAKWPFATFCAGESYGENLQLLKESFFENMLRNANFEEYASLNIKGIVLKETDMRAFPTDRPLLKDPSLAGEGFPFDYLQNSSVHANKPIFVSHYSKDREWAFIFSSFAFGWIKTDEFVVLDKKYTSYWQKAKQISIIKEGEALYDKNGNFLFTSKIGMRFPIVSEDAVSYTVLTVSSYKNRKPLFLTSKISKETATEDTLKLDPENITKIVNEVSKTNYGWGGMYGQRDCSSMIRDMFAPFGIWLPRNSYRQSKIGEVISLENMSDEEKIDTIKEKAVAFQTLLYKKGHILLYVGTYNDEIVVFHNTWGIKTKKEGFKGRVIIGKAIFSSLRLGRYQEDYDEEGEILKNLISMNILTK